MSKSKFGVSKKNHNKLLWKLLKLSSVVVAATFISTNRALAQANQQVNQAVSQNQLTQQSKNIGQITSVSQFSDVQPTDWAFQALQSLVERYGCIAGYPNGTYRGNRALTRYEFAAGLNACLDRVNELIATATADLIKKEDLATLQRLQEEFSAELVTLRGRVDVLEERAAELEANQFSTTTKLNGEVIFAVANARGDDLDDDFNNTIFANRVRLNFDTSFSGTDRLRVRLQARNIPQLTYTDMARLGFDGDEGNNVNIDDLYYQFNLGNALRVTLAAAATEYNDALFVFNPAFESSGTGAISRFGRFSPIYRASDGAGLIVTFGPNSPISASVGYIAPTANNPTSGNGIINGAYSALAQIVFRPSNTFNLGLTYAHAYFNNESGVNLFGSTGGFFANRPLIDNATSANHYGIEVLFRPSSKITLTGWAGYSTANVELDDDDIFISIFGDIEAEMLHWAGAVAIQDFGGKGNTLGFIFGQPPKVIEHSIEFLEDLNTSYHLEALYKVQVSDNVLITPGVFVIFNPEHNSANETIYVGTLRTTFSF